MVNELIKIFQIRKCTVIERARLQMILSEQQVRLTHSSEDEADLLRIGKLAGVDYMVFAESKVQSAISSGAFVNMYGGASHTNTFYHVSVSVRSVDVETGEVRWAGSAHYGGAINNPEAGIVKLTLPALARATCRIEEGYEWSDEPRADNSMGCRKKK